MLVNFLAVIKGTFNVHFEKNQNIHSVICRNFIVYRLYLYIFYLSISKLLFINYIINFNINNRKIRTIYAYYFIYLSKKKE